MSWRFWSLGVCLAIALAAACSGKSRRAQHSDTSSGGSGGEGGTQLTAGEAGESAETENVVGPTSTTTTFATLTTVGGASTSLVTNTVGMGGSTMPPPNPGEWHCNFNDYDDGICDCGCGVIDLDCESGDLDECETCNVMGSCSAVGCPGRVDPEDTTRCTPAPDAWTCFDQTYLDGFCDCGCGALDPDCEDETSASCDRCNLSGACSAGACPSSIAEDDNARCDVPDDWTCAQRYYGDGYCHCGCGTVDMDCDSSTVDDCDVCHFGCSNEVCPGTIDPDDNGICTGPPWQWTCNERFFGDGALCHCGCGAPDPDCSTDDLDACDRCNFEGSCSVQDCPGTIDPDDTAHCIRPDPPETWTCEWYRYADGWQCDCGCGAPDPDCPTDGIESCDTCYACGTGSCPGRVDPEDTSACLLVPDDWTCSAYSYGDGYSCDCGCGILDLDCDSNLASSCDYCPYYSGSCSEYYCAEIVPDDNTRCYDTPPNEWTCDPGYYADQACDCGCGARDLDCSSAEATVCEFCDDEGSCSSDACPGTIDPADNALCVVE